MVDAQILASIANDIRAFESFVNITLILNLFSSNL